MEREPKIKKLIENIKRPFVAIFGNDISDEQALKEELEELNRIQFNLKEDKDFNSNIKEPKDFVQKVNVKGKSIRRKDKKIEHELTEAELGWEK